VRKAGSPIAVPQQAAADLRLLKNAAALHVEEYGQ
jgi:hypothetical protein